MCLILLKETHMHKISNSHTLHRKISPACRKKHGVIMRKSLGSPRDIRFQNTYLKNEIKKIQLTLAVKQILKRLNPGIWE